MAASNGRGQLGDDKLAYRRQLIGLASHPNNGAVLIVGADRISADAVADALSVNQKPHAVVTLDDVHEDALALTDGASGSARASRTKLAANAGPPCPSPTYSWEIECGHSDATSGLVSNPLAGATSDLLVDLGATTVVGETLEWLGAEHVLARRAVSKSVAEAIVAAVQRREASAAATGMNLVGNNPGPENIRGGLSSIEEKSLGAIAKAGARPISPCSLSARSKGRPGLHLMDGPGFSPEIAHGIRRIRHPDHAVHHRAGQRLLDRLAPTIKISAHPETARRMPEQIDFDASPVLLGKEEAGGAARRLLSLVVDVASGSPTWGEILDEGDEVPVRLGASSEIGQSISHRGQRPAGRRHPPFGHGGGRARGYRARPRSYPARRRRAGRVRKRADPHGPQGGFGSPRSRRCDPEIRRSHRRGDRADYRGCPCPCAQSA